jgi:hypothetical protein
MATRYAKPGEPLNQERYASSYDRGLLGNLVSKRYARLESPVEKQLIWFIQWLSWQPRSPLPLDLRQVAESWCLDPRAALSESQLSQLIEARQEFIRSASANKVQTTIGKRISKALEYTRSANVLTLIDGPSRIGKSFAARSWCEQSAGAARYVEVASSTDETAFLHRIAKALGVSSNLNSKAMELRARVEDVLQTGGIMLVLDEAHYLWPQGRLKTCTAPHRVNWINTALANFGVPVALITTPQFYTVQRNVERLTGWNSDQFIGRVGHVERLPERLEQSDLMAVAAALIPGITETAAKKLALYAEISRKHLASIDEIAKRAKWIARESGRDLAGAEDVNRAIKEGVIPSDSALAVSLGKTTREGAALPPPVNRESLAEPSRLNGLGHFDRARLPNLIVK